MVAVYEEFTSSDFAALVARYGNRIVQPATGHLPYGEFVQPRAAQIQAADLPDVQPAAAQIAPMPCLLALTTFTNIVEILNRTRTAQERLFYIVYSFRERLKKLELRRCLVNDTYSSWNSILKRSTGTLSGRTKIRPSACCCARTQTAAPSNMLFRGR